MASSNSTNLVPIMEIPFINVTKEELISHHLLERLENKVKTYVVTANPEIVMMANENQAFKDTILHADYVVPDGAGIVVASNLMKNPLKERIPGFELMQSLIHHAEKKGLRCYFLGAKKTVNDKAVANLQELYPDLKIVGKNHGFFDLEDIEVVNQIKKTEPDLIFVALGAPNQEKWIVNHYHLFNKGLFMGVGGSFDVLAGEVKRAPKLWIKLNLEWLYRLIKQPYRWKRILKVFEFMFKVLLKKY